MKTYVCSFCGKRLEEGRLKALVVEGDSSCAVEYGNISFVFHDDEYCDPKCFAAAILAHFNKGEKE